MVFTQKIERQFENITQTMLSEIDIATSTTNHYPTRGRNNEQILIKFLKKFLPSRYSISQGQIVSPSASLSPQMDIIIHDETIYPVATVLESGEKVVFAHSVYAVISVKSTLKKIQNHSQIESLLENLKQTNEIEKESKIASRGVDEVLPDISYFGFAFNKSDDHLIDILNSNSIIKDGYVKAIALLDSDNQTHGFYLDPGRTGEMQFMAKERNTLLAFYRTLFNTLCSKDIIEPGTLEITKKIIKIYKPWGDWGFD